MDPAVAALIGQFGALSVSQKREFKNVIANNNEANLANDIMGNAIIQCARFYLKRNIGITRHCQAAAASYATIMNQLTALGVPNIPTFDAYNATVSGLTKAERFDHFMQTLDDYFNQLSALPFTVQIGQALFILDAAIEWMNEIVI